MAGSNKKMSSSGQSRITNFFTVNGTVRKGSGENGEANRASKGADARKRLSLKHKRGTKESTVEDANVKKAKVVLPTDAAAQTPAKHDCGLLASHSGYKNDSTATVTPCDVPKQSSSNVSGGDVEGETESVGSDDSQRRVPYYFESFVTILNCVMTNDDDWKLFDDTEKACVSKFLDLDDACQKLYIRLLQRKHDWKRPSKITYPDISTDLDPVLRQLQLKGFLEHVTKVTDLKTALDLLVPAELRSLAKFFKLRTATGTKTVLTKALVDHAGCHKSVMGQASPFSIHDLVLKQAVKMTGDAYKLAEEPRNIFQRILMLFSLGTSWDVDEERAEGTTQLYMLLLVSIGKLSFPEYPVDRKTVLFPSRDDLLRFEAARNLEADLIKATESRDWNLAHKLFLTAEEMLRCPEMERHRERDRTVLQFLRHFSPCHVYTRCCGIGVDVLQRLKKYQEAVDLLRSLLGQDLYCQSSRGRWWERVALNLDAHLNQPKEALRAIKEGLNDPRVRPQFRYALYNRAEKILSSSSGRNVETSLDDFPCVRICRAPEVTIEGRLIPRKIPGRNYLFVSSEPDADDADVRVVGVEELALEHYMREGYTEGVHGEGSTFQALFALLCWDVIYDANVRDVFRTPYQAFPLDLNSDTFFSSREGAFLQVLDEIRNTSTEELEESVSASYEKHAGQTSLVQWDRFTCTQMKGLARCFGGKKLSSLCERLARDYRHCRSGLPDLVVWNVATGALKAVEVKGPGDVLSSKQIIWLDYLLSIGVDSEVCHIKGIIPDEVQALHESLLINVDAPNRLVLLKAVSSKMLSKSKT